MNAILAVAMIGVTITLGGCALADKAIEFATTPIHPQPTDDQSAQACQVRQDSIDESRFGDCYSWREGSIEFEVGKDVDSVYPKIKREFGYLTKEETLRQPQGEWIVETSAFTYVTSPGSMYEMSKGWVKHSFEGNERTHVLSVLLEKDGDQTDVAMTFWLKDPDIDMASYGKSLEKRINDIFD